MRTLLLIAVVAAPVLAQPDDGAAMRDSLVAEARSRIETLNPPSGFSATWNDTADRLSATAGGHAPDGIFRSHAMPLGWILEHAWTSDVPYGERSLSPTVSKRLIDAPDGFLRRQVDVSMNLPDLTRETFGPALVERLGDALGFEVRTEERPTVVYALRHADPTVVLPDEVDGAAHLTSLSWGQTFFVRGATGQTLAKKLGAAIGHVVIDETGLDDAVTLRLDFEPHEVDFEEHTLSAGAIDAVRARLRAETGFELVPEVRPVEWLVVRDLTPRSER